MADDNKTTNATSTAKPAAAEPTKAAAPAEAKPAAKAPAKPRTVKAPTIRRPAVRRTAVKAAAPAAAAKETSLKEVSLDDPSLYINRDISWIEFDRKVLETAMDPRDPAAQPCSLLVHLLQQSRRILHGSRDERSETGQKRSRTDRSG